MGMGRGQDLVTMEMGRGQDLVTMGMGRGQDLVTTQNVMVMFTLELTLPLLQVIIITGDNPLTACHVARELDITRKKVLVLNKDRNGEWVWQNTGGRDVLSLDTSTRELGDQYDLCITGEVCDLVGLGRRYMVCSTGEEVHGM